MCLLFTKAHEKSSETICIFWGLVKVFMGCGVLADGSCLFFFWRCTRRSECRRAEEKNGWLWSPRQQCVKIVSFYPPNLSCKKTQKVQQCISSHSFYLFVLHSSFCLPLAPHNTIPQTCTAWVINNFFIVNQRPWTVSIHSENCKLAYYNRPGWLYSQQPEDGKPLLCTFFRKLFFPLTSWLLSSLSDSPLCFFHLSFSTVVVFLFKRKVSVFNLTDALILD